MKNWLFLPMFQEEAGIISRIYQGLELKFKLLEIFLISMTLNTGFILGTKGQKLPSNY